MAKKVNNNRERKIEKYQRQDFELTVSSNCLTVKEVVDMYNRGALQGEEYCFLWDNMLKIAKELAYGWWNNAALRVKPAGRHALESRSLMVQKSIMEAFTSMPSETTSKEDH